jgi:hypothetical protein
VFAPAWQGEAISAKQGPAEILLQFANFFSFVGHGFVLRDVSGVSPKKEFYYYPAAFCLEASVRGSWSHANLTDVTGSPSAVPLTIIAEIPQMHSA